MKRVKSDGNNQARFNIIESPKYDAEEEYTLDVKSPMNSFL